MEKMIMAAPLQGYTDAVWREAHKEVYGKAGGSADRYFTPFIRVEHGGVRNRDIHGLLASLSDMPESISAQIIFRDVEEFRHLTKAIVGVGCRSIDLNLGCPYPMQTRKGRGAAALVNLELLEKISAEMKKSPDIQWSAKMRLGMSEPHEWRRVAEIISGMPLEWLTVHPRVATQGYKGDLYSEEIDGIIETVCHPVVFNGELRTPGDIAVVLERWSGLAGVMTGRGILARPSLIVEYRSGEVWDKETRLEHIRMIHDIMLDEYVDVIEGGGHQVLSKMMAFWEYLEPEIGHKQFKSLKKSRTLEGYLKVVKSLGR